MPFTCPFCGLAPTQPGHLCQYCRKPLYPNGKQPPGAYTSTSAFPSQSRPLQNQMPQVPPRPAINQIPSFPAPPMMHQVPPQSMVNQMPPVPPQPMMNQMPPMPSQPMMNQGYQMSPQPIANQGYQMPPQPMMNQGYQMPPQGMPHYAPQAPLYGAPAPYQQVQQRYTSVSGWLLFFCISLTIITPLLRSIDVLADIGAVVNFSGAPLIQFALLFDALLNLGVIGICIYAGVHLWGVKPNGVKLAKFALGTIAIYIIVSIPLAILIAVNLSSEDAAAKMGAEMGIAILRTLVYVGTWYSYLNKSVRVKETFGLQN